MNGNSPDPLNPKSAIDNPQSQYFLQLVHDALDVIEFLSGKEADFLGPKVVAEGTGLDANKAFRILHNLESRAWAESKDGAYRLAPRFVRYSENYRLSVIERAKKLEGEMRDYLGVIHVALEMDADEIDRVTKQNVFDLAQLRKLSPEQVTQILDILGYEPAGNEED